MKKTVIAYCYANGHLPYYSGKTHTLYIEHRANIGLREQIFKEFGKLTFGIKFQYSE